MLQIEDLNLPELNIDQTIADIDAQLIDGAFATVERITLDRHADLLVESVIHNTFDHGGMRVQQIIHPTIGKATLIQGCGDGATLIKHPFF